MKIYHNLLLPVGLLSATIIGAGVFALPYVFSQTGLTASFSFLIIATVASICTHLFYADVILRTPGEHRFPGHVRVYLGNIMQWCAVWSAVIEAIVVLTIYLLLSLRFSMLVTGAISESTAFGLFWLFASLTIFLRVRRLAALEFIITLGIIGILSALFVYGFPAVSRLSLVEIANQGMVSLLPLAPILFALSGRVAIPQLVRYVRERHLHVEAQRIILRRSIFLGTFIPALLYGLFVVSVIALSQVVTDDAVTGLTAALPPWLLQGIGILGLLSLFSSYIVVGRDVYGALIYDLGLYKLFGVFLVLFAPLALYTSGARDFIDLVSLVGGVFLALEGLMIVAMWFVANRLRGGPLLITRWFGYPFALMTLAVFATAFFVALWSL